MGTEITPVSRTEEILNRIRTQTTAQPLTKEQFLRNMEFARSSKRESNRKAGRSGIGAGKCWVREIALD